MAQVSTDHNDDNKTMTLSCETRPCSPGDEHTKRVARTSPPDAELVFSARVSDMAQWDKLPHIKTYVRVKNPANGTWLVTARIPAGHMMELIQQQHAFVSCIQTGRRVMPCE
jgi:hypothetical protein